MKGPTGAALAPAPGLWPWRVSGLGRGATLLIAHGLVALAALLPLAIVEVPLIADFPNHLARAHVLGQIGVDPVLARIYQVRFEVIPNLAMDLLVPALGRIMPLEVAGRLFLALTLLMTQAGVALLHRTVSGRWSLWPLAAALLLYNAAFLAGLANFAFGIGLMLLALTVWIRLERTPPWLRLAVGAGFAMMLLFCHLVALGAYGLAAIGHELRRRPGRAMRRPALAPGEALRRPGFWLALGQLVPAAALFLLAAPVARAGAGIQYAGLAWKAKALLAPLAQYHPWLDAASFAFLAGLLTLGFVRGWLRLAPALAPAVALLGLAFAIAPKGFLSGGLFDLRFAVIAALLLVAATLPRLPSARARWAVGGLLAGLFLIRQLALLDAWAGHQADLAELHAALGQVPRGASILAATPTEFPAGAGGPARHFYFYNAAQMGNLPAIAVIERAAFVSGLYALPGQQPMALTPPYRDLVADAPTDLPSLARLHAAYERPDDPAVPANLRRWWQRFDQVLVVYAYQGTGEVDLAGLPLDLLVDGELLDLYAVTGADRR